MGADYVLRSTPFDVSTATALQFTPRQRREFVSGLIAEFRQLAVAGSMALHASVSAAVEHRDLRRLVGMDTDTYLRLDERTFLRNVLMVGAPGATHAHWSRHQRWQTAGGYGHLPTLIADQDERLRRQIERVINPAIASKEIYRQQQKVLPAIYAFLRQHYSVGCAFPPFHARFLADLYLPQQGVATVFDPCAGYGGRLLGVLCVPRRDVVRYYGVDPCSQHRGAYHALIGRARSLMPWPREARVVVDRFERWIDTPDAAVLHRATDMVITSPPYFDAQIVDPMSPDQSANQFPTYPAWRDGFLRVLIEGAYRLLKSDGIFVINIADVRDVPLEHDTLMIAGRAGFVQQALFKLAMNITPGTKAHRPRHWVRVDGKVWKCEPVFVFRA